MSICNVVAGVRFQVRLLMALFIDLCVGEDKFLLLAGMMAQLQIVAIVDRDCLQAMTAQAQKHSHLATEVLCFCRSRSG